MSIGAHSVRENCAHSDLPDGALANACVGDYIALLVGLELLDGVDTTVRGFALCLVDSSICAGGDEAEDGILVRHAFAGSVALRAVHAHGVSDQDVAAPFIERLHQRQQRTASAMVVVVVAAVVEDMVDDSGDIYAICPYVPENA